MLSIRKVSDLAHKVAADRLGSGQVEEVRAAPFLDSRGNDALKIVVIVAPGAVEDASGDTLLDILVDVQKRLHRQGDDRFAIVEYATRAEMTESVDP